MEPRYASRLKQPLEITFRLLDPIAARQRIRTESLQVAFLLIVIEGAVKPQVAGFGIIDEAGGIIAGHGRPQPRPARRSFANSTASCAPRCSGAIANGSLGS